MRKAFLTALCTTAIGFSHPTTVWSQSVSVAPAANKSIASHLPKAGFDATVKMKKSKIRRGVLIEDVRKDDSWYRQMRDPGQVEG